MATKTTLLFSSWACVVLATACSGGGGGSVGGVGADGGAATGAASQDYGTFERVIHGVNGPDTIHRLAFAKGSGVQVVEQTLATGRSATVDCFDFERVDAKKLRITWRFERRIQGDTTTKTDSNGAVEELELDVNASALYGPDFDGHGNYETKRVATPTPETVLQECVATLRATPLRSRATLSCVNLA